MRLVDAADEIGGCMRWIPHLPGLEAWSRFTEWRRREIGRLANLELATGARLDRGDGLVDERAELLDRLVVARRMDPVGEQDQEQAVSFFIDHDSIL